MSAEPRTASEEKASRRPETAPPLESLYVENYRCFPEYRIEKFGWINLLVGPNAGGKSSVLDACALLVSDNPGLTIERITEQRREVDAIDPDEVQLPTGRRKWLPNVSGFFHGRVAKFGTSLRLADAREDADARYRFRLSLNASNIASLRDPGSPALAEPLSAVRCRVSRTVPGKPHDEETVYAVRPPASLLVGSTQYLESLGSFDQSHVATIWANGYDETEQKRAFAELSREGREDVVLGPLRLIEPDLEDVRLSTDFASSGLPVGAEFFARIGKGERRVPVGSLGEGLKRLLGLTLALHAAPETAGAKLLIIDEIDTALHYSIMPDVWRLIIDTALARGVQVIAATHSLDCLRGLAEVCETNPEVAPEVMVHAVDKRLKVNQPIVGSDIPFMVFNNVEIR